MCSTPLNVRLEYLRQTFPRTTTWHRQDALLDLNHKVIWAMVYGAVWLEAAHIRCLNHILTNLRNLVAVKVSWTLQIAPQIANTNEWLS